MSRSRGTRVQVVGVAVITVLSVALTGLAAGTAQAASESTLAKNDPGIGTAQALENPRCDPATKRMKYQSYGAPLCVKAWKNGADNGGATAQGVTAKTIKVAVLYGDLPAQQLATKGLYTNQATGENSPTAPIDSTRDNNEIYKYAYETWGRNVEFTFVKATGTDEAAQRADAVEVASLKPFAVLDEATLIGTPPVGGGAVFEQALRNAGVPRVIGLGELRRPRPDVAVSTRCPRPSSSASNSRAAKPSTPATDMQDQTRKFGVIYSSNFDIDFFKSGTQEARRDARVGGLLHRGAG